MKIQEPIDIVISWVDGNDPMHRQKMQPYLNKSEYIQDDIAGPTRFRSEGEIFFCVASILRFAPFVRKIFIVTDQQNPNLDDFIHTNFPQNTIPIILVDHSVIFKGYEIYMPTFNSLSIETCLFRIPDLSENFVYFNDDFFLMRPIQPSDWFRSDKVMAYGNWRSITFDLFLQSIKPMKNGHKPFGFKDSMLNATNYFPKKTFYFCIKHTPLPLKKSIFEKYYEHYSENLIANIAHKFRNETQYNPQALFYLLAFKSKVSILISKNKLLLIKPVNRKSNYVDRKIKTFEKNKNILFGCIESIDLAKKEDQTKLYNWLSKLLNIKLIL